MHLRKLDIENFRAIKELHLVLNDGANLLIGPNAVGKTTVLQAIRFCKALLAPRTQNEPRTCLASLGVTPMHLPQQQNFAAITGDISKAIKVSCEYLLTDEELSLLPRLHSELVRRVIAAQTGIAGDNNQQNLLQFMSSPAGMEMKTQVEGYVVNHLGRIASTRTCVLSLTVDPSDRSFVGHDIFGQLLFTVLESRLSPDKSLFSYFPADRALPPGEVPIQLGSADAQQQLESHNSSPELKYQRLKSTIFSASLASVDGREKMAASFKSIFSHVLKNRELIDFSINEHGQATIRVRDTADDKTFDIDSMSSGEKGLILTFLLLERSIESGGIVLLDEPELHLNPAVCKDLLEFLIQTYLAPFNVQALICTHSPEILSVAMRADHASVFHLRPGGTASLIRKQDQPEIAEALRLLGTSEVEEMLYEAVIFVEGIDDVEVLETAFPSLLSRIKFRDLTGRAEVEKHIRRLQEAEKVGDKDSISYFLFDRDNRPTNLQSSPKVKIDQWGRYCLENYLLDTEILFDLLKKEFATGKTPKDLGSATQLFERIAKRQLRSRVIDEVYKRFAYENPGLRPTDRDTENFDDSAQLLYSRLERIRQQVSLIEQTKWKSSFVQECEALLQAREQEWSATWVTQCSGKQFFKDLYKECGLSARPVNLKRRLIQENRFFADGSGSENWKLLKEKVDGLLQN